MYANLWEEIASAAASEEAQLGNQVAGVESAVGAAVTAAVPGGGAIVGAAQLLTGVATGIALNAGPLMVGIGFGFLGVLMLVFAFGESLAETAEKVAGTAAQVVAKNPEVVA